MTKWLYEGLIVVYLTSFTTMAFSDAPIPKSVSPSAPISLTLEPAALELARNVIGNTLPKLINANPILARQLGFSPEDLDSFKESGGSFAAPIPVFFVSLRDIFEFIKHTETNPVELIKKEVNWVESADGTFVPARWLFPITLKRDDGRETVIPRSSVTIGRSNVEPWHIHQIGGPNLIRAVQKHASPNTVSLVWIPGINRHYLGQVYDRDVKLKVLFDDPLAKVKAGHEFDPSDQSVIEKLKKLEEMLQPKETQQDPAPGNHSSKAINDTNRNPSKEEGK
jgi:hypothetical protein